MAPLREHQEQQQSETPARESRELPRSTPPASTLDSTKRLNRTTIVLAVIAAAVVVLVLALALG
jgi:hypothetical protein